MSASQPKEPVSSNKVETHRLWLGKSLANSAAAMLIELGITLAGAESSAPISGLCSRCGAHRDPQSSTVRYPNVFCSEPCEQEFVRAALGSLTLGDCIRIQHRLETLLMGTQKPVLQV